MIGEIFSGILGVVFLAGAVMQFRCKGPIWSTEYIASTPRERKKLKTRQEYYWTGAACLWIGLLFLLALTYSLTEINGFLYALFVVAVFLSLHILYGICRAVKKSTLRGNESENTHIEKHDGGNGSGRMDRRSGVDKDGRADINKKENKRQD